MNVKSLIQQMKLRPAMYVGKINLEVTFHFINGFLYNNIITDRVDNIDLAFKNQFDEWVKLTLEKKKNISFNEQRNLLFYITQVCKSEEERLEMFFELCEEFFNQISKEETDTANYRS